MDNIVFFSIIALPTRCSMKLVHSSGKIQVSTSADQNHPPAPICNQNATSAVCSVEIKEESRPKLMTKAAMKVFEPPANQVKIHDIMKIANSAGNVCFSSE